jgi:fructose transport system substrate-binding protein
LTALALLAALAASATPPQAMAQATKEAEPGQQAQAAKQAQPGKPAQPVIGLITRSEQVNPYFAALRRGAEQAARDLDVRLLSATGEAEETVGGQLAALDRLLASGARVILITPADSRALVPALARARARGVLVLALDGPTEPASAVDAVISSDNLEAGALAGRYGRALW